MFNNNEKVVYPGHGVAKINRIVEKPIAGKITRFFELRFLNKDMIILVPVDSAISVGIRPLSSTKYINDIFKMLAEPIVHVNNESTIGNWNKRNKEYQGKLRSGNLREICAIYRDLKHIEKKKELSFGEKSLLCQTESLLVEEIAIVKKVKEEMATKQLRASVKSEQNQVA